MATCQICWIPHRVLLFSSTPTSVPSVILSTQKLQELGKEEELSDEAAPQLPLSMEHLRLTPLQRRQHALQRVHDQLSNCAQYSGVGIVYEELLDPWISPRLENALSKLNFKLIEVDQDAFMVVDLKTVLSAIAQSEAYPKPGSRPFVIVIFVAGMASHSTDLLRSLFRPKDINIIDHIIKPFLPQSAPHLAHFQKLFFISCDAFPFGEHFDTQPPPFPTDPDANYCVAYLVAHNRSTLVGWTNYIIESLLSGIPLQDIVESSRAHFGKKDGYLHFFSCLQDKLELSY